jgi:hypothetical protein
VTAEHESAGTIVVGEVVALAAPSASRDRLEEAAPTRAYRMKRDHYGSR